jgi:CspA family cold shock protein
MSSKDETLYCERCGISFLWTSEERSRAAMVAARPLLCPGCRHLLPQEGQERGLVRWYNRRKRYGFISCQDGADIFVHGSSLRNTRLLREGDLVEFEIDTSANRSAAAAVNLLLSAKEQKQMADDG